MNFARSWTIFQMDFRFHTTRPLVWMLLIVLALVSFGLSSGSVTIASGDSTVGGQSKVWMTSEFSIAMMFPLVAFLFYVFFVAIGAGMAVPRDDELQVLPVLHATRLTPTEYVFGKFAAVLATFLLVLAAHVALQIAFNHWWPHANVEETRGPFEAVNYLRPALLLALPCLLFFCGSSFALGEFTRQPLTVVLFPLVFFLVAIFFLFDWSPSWLDPRVNRLLMWLEPSGFRWINETWIKVDKGVEFYNHNPVGYDAPFLASRAVYALLGIGFVAGARRHFARTLRGTAAKPAKRRPRDEAAASTSPAAASTAPIAALSMRSRAPGFLRTVLDVARFEARNLASQPGLYLFVPIILIQTVGSLSFELGAFDTPLLLTPGIAAANSMNTLTLLVCFLLLFYSVESVVREWNTRFAPIYYATPARTGAFLLGKAVANAIVAAVVLVAAMIGVAIVLLVQGKVAFELRPFVILWGGLLLPTFLVWASFVACVLAVTGNRYLTYAVGIAAIAFTGWKQFRGEMNWVGNWNLWSAVTWTDFGGTDPNTNALVWNRAFYLAVLVLLVALTVRVFPRREHDSARAVDRFRGRFLGRTVLKLVPVALPALALGVFLYSSVHRGFQGKVAEKADKDYWKRNVETWKDAPTPGFAGVVIDVTLDPNERWFSVEGEYRLVNDTDEPMRRFPMSTGNHFENIVWTLEGESFEPEDRAGLFVFDLAEPLSPGQETVVGFSHEGRYPNGITKNGGGMSTFILPSGVVLTSFDSGFLPIPYFEEERGVDEENETATRDYDDDYWMERTPPGLGTGVRFPVRTTIRGPVEFDYHGVGVRSEDTVENGLRKVVWESDFPVNFFNVVAAKWDVWEGEGVSIYHHPKHTYNIEEMGEALAAARKYFSEWFYPYPWADLRLNEFPGLAGYAQGFPTNITFSERIGFLTRSKPESQAAFLVTAHEAAHQWWGNLLMPGDGPGGNILSEGLAHFSTILLIGQVQGERDRIEFCKRLEEKYGDDRQVDSEKALIWIDGSKEGDTTVMYDKGGWVFWMLHELLGAEASFAGLHAFIDAYGETDDFPLLQDFVEAMRVHAGDPIAYDAFVSQWFFDVVMPEYRFHDVRKERVGDEWVVRGEIENAGTGELAVEVAASRGERFPDEGSAGAAEWHLERTPVALGPQARAAFTITCPFEPERVLVDPDALLLMLERGRAIAEL